VCELKKIKIGEHLAKLQGDGCLMQFARLANALLKDEESARDNHVLVCNFAKYSPFLKFRCLVNRGMMGVNSCLRLLSERRS